MVMKKLIFIPLLFFFGILSAQDLDGSWRLIKIDEKPVIDTVTVKIYQDGYFSIGSKKAKNDEFLYAAGGEYSNDNGSYSETFDFYTKDSSMVGQQKDYELDLRNKELMLLEFGGKTETWEKISDNINDLSGNWVITGRKRNGEISRSTPGARRTIKILGGDRFQWVAFNSDTGEFFGSGGGTYSAKDGKYIEKIDFFSRDNSRVGAELPFKYEVKDGEWHHSGKSSKGEELYEIWSPYRKAYKK